MTGRYMVIKDGREISNHNKKELAERSAIKNGGYVQYHVGKTEADNANKHNI